MGSSKKHKKHKDKDRERRSHAEPASEPRPLKLVLKVGGGSSMTTATVGGHSSGASTPSNHVQDPEPMEDNRLTLQFDREKGEMTSFGSSKKMKKKKSKKKHKKHSHHHHHHHSSHHRHHSSCSHRSKSSSHNAEASIIPEASDMLTDINMPSTSDVPIIQINPPPVTVIPPNVPIRQRFKKSATKLQFLNFVSPLLKSLQRRDSQEFFAWPVTELIAPGYSSIIQRPMDFSTVKKNVEQGFYDNISDLKADVKLICDNAMTYNHPETIYYKAARKLWHFAKEKVFNKFALIEQKRIYPGIGSYELGFSVDEPGLPVDMEIEPVMPSVDACQQTALDLPNHLPPELITMEALVEEKEELEDGMTADEILDHARRAAEAAADRLTLERPHGAHFSFLRQHENGSTSLSVLGAQNEIERPFTLGNVVGRLTEGSAHLCSFKELEMNKVRPIETLETSAFSSYLPCLDSSKATLSQEDSALLLATYGDDEVGVQYANSLLQFAGDSDYMVNMVDSLLDVLTHGQHSKAAVKVKEKGSKEQNVTDTTEIADVMSESKSIQSELDETSSLISQLESTQNQRLSSTPMPTKPNEEEITIATKLQLKLAEMIGNYTAPSDILDIKSVRKAMGIQLKGEVNS
ncbi:Bromodomain-containing protein 7 [Halotydeus destructor]|nr:Bromodomain-containing protein 7 [Halotydeus destructor]